MKDEYIIRPQLRFILPLTLVSLAITAFLLHLFRDYSGRYWLALLPALGVVLGLYTMFSKSRGYVRIYEDRLEATLRVPQNKVVVIQFKDIKSFREFKPHGSFERIFTIEKSDGSEWSIQSNYMRSQDYWNLYLLIKGLKG